MNPRVKSVSASSDYKLYIEFTNGEHGVYDCSPLLNFGVFQELKDLKYFKLARVLDGTVVWPHEQDICPDTLYMDSTKYAEPSTPADARTSRG
jgi:hypothetical protein